MKHPKQLLTVLLMGVACTLQAQRSETLLEVKEISKKRASRSLMIPNGNRLLFHMIGQSSVRLM